MENTFDRPIIPANEEERLAKLHSLNIIDTYDEHGPFKHIAAMASRMFDVPIAIVNLVDKDQVVSIASEGMGYGKDYVPRGTSLCSLAILNSHATVFEDAKQEPCLLANPLVHGQFGLQFYAAAPLVTSDGYKIGALCIVDKKPKTFSELDQRILGNLASIVVEEIEKSK